MVHKAGYLLPNERLQYLQVLINKILRIFSHTTLFTCVVILKNVSLFLEYPQHIVGQESKTYIFNFHIFQARQKNEITFARSVLYC